MCDFFSFVTDPENRGGERFYFDWKQRLDLDPDDSDSHSTICSFYGLIEDKCNKFEYNPLTGAFAVDQINSPVDDRVQVEEWVRKLDFKRVVEPLIVKPIINPQEIEAGEVTEEVIEKLRQWASVGAFVGASVGASVWDSVGDSVWDSVWYSIWYSAWNSVRASVWYSVRASAWYSVVASVRASVRASVWDSIWDSIVASVRAYMLSFFAVEYDYDFTSAVWLWEHGYVPSFDGTTWRLHTGKDAKIVYEVEGETRCQSIELN